MPTKLDDNRLPAPSQLLFDVLTRIEQLKRSLANTEAMTHGAEEKLARLPYFPWPVQPPEPNEPGQFTESGPLAERSPMSPSVTSRQALTPASDPASDPEDERNQRLDVGRLHTYVCAASTSMHDVMAECDQLITYTRTLIKGVRDLRSVPAERTHDEAGHAADEATLATEGRRDAPRGPDPAKVVRAARAAARKPSTPKPPADAPDHDVANKGDVARDEYERAAIMARYLADMRAMN
ncbi:hypothetical protein [Haliangium sp.]|uniref:hypothetical protein n=1 Tax=Haliangium sp. TaxID=2663208 RepID=UPI003D0B9130